MKIRGCIFVVSAFALAAYADGVWTWKGGTAGGWSTPSNWEPASVPPDESTVVIPSGTSVTLPENLSVSTIVSGEGTVGVCDNAQLKRIVGQPFTGTISVAGGRSVSLDSLGSLAAAGLILTQGSKLTLPSKLLAAGGREEIQSWTNTSQWAFVDYKDAVGSVWHPEVTAPNLPSVENTSASPCLEEGTDNLILTDSPADKCTVIYTNRVFRRSDDWEISVTVQPSHEGGEKFEAVGYKQAWAEGYHILLQADGPNALGGRSESRPNTSYGFYIHLYDRVLRWVEAGALVGDPVGEAALGGINLCQSVDYRVRCADGVLFVTLQQGEKKADLKRDIGGFFDQTKAKEGGYLTFYGNSGWWGSSTIPWAFMRLSGFSGSYRTAQRTEVDISDEKTTLSADAWKMFGSAQETADAGHVQLTPDEQKKWGQANCRTPLRSFKTPFKATYSFVSESEAFRDHAEGFSFALQSTGVDASIGGYGETKIWQSDGYGVGFKAYEGKVGIFDSSNLPTAWSPPDRGTYKYQSIHGDFAVEYDGLGGLSYSVGWKTDEASETVSGSGSKVLSATFERLKDKPMYFSFIGSTASWDCRAKFDVGDFKLFSWQNAAAPVDPLSVAAGATADLVVGGYMTDSNPAADLSVLRLGGGATLAVSPELETSRLLVRCVELAGSGSLSLDPDVTVELEKVSFSSPTMESLAISGEGTLTFGGELEIVVPHAAMKSCLARTRIISFGDGVVTRGSVPQVLTLKDETGRVYEDLLTVSDDGVYLERKGLVLIVR